MVYPADAHHSRPAEPTRSAEPVRDDVEQVCKHMAGSVQERTGRRPAVTRVFRCGAPLKTIGKAVVGLQTGENSRFVRTWQEVSWKDMEIGIPSREEAQQSEKKWFPYNKGGNFCRWYGNQEYIVNWESDGKEIQSFTDSNGRLRSRPQNTELYFSTSISWSKISSALPAFRMYPTGFIFDVAGTSIFLDDPCMFLYLLGYCNSKMTTGFLKILSQVSGLL